MLQPYSLSMRSVFNVDLVLGNRVLHSTPPRLEQDNRSYRVFSKFVRKDRSSSFDILFEYVHWYPHPESWRKPPYVPEWLMATVSLVLDEKDENGTNMEIEMDQFRIPCIVQEGRQDRRIILTVPQLTKQVHPSLDQHDENGDKLNTYRDVSLGPAASSGTTGTTTPYAQLVVRTFRTKHPEIITTNDQRCTEFRLFLAEDECYERELGKVMDDEIGRDYLRNGSIADWDQPCRRSLVSCPAPDKALSRVQDVSRNLQKLMEDKRCGID